MAKPLGFMYALGLKGLPTSIDVQGRKYVLEKVQKHDFWAATGFYLRTDEAVADAVPEGFGSHDSARVDYLIANPTSFATFNAALPTRLVAKINRQTSLLGLPLRWVGRWLRNRETRSYARLQDVPGIPALLGDITDTGFLHAYVEGSPLKKGMPLDDQFFANLFRLIDTLHKRGIAYVDTNKPENILLGDDGLPYLIDFQISFDQSACWPRWLARKLLRNFYEADVYHALKQKRRFRPDLLTAAERERFDRVTVLHKLHRVIRKPYFMIRRPMMRWLERSGRAQKIGSD